MMVPSDVQSPRDRRLLDTGGCLGVFSRHANFLAYPGSGAQEDGSISLFKELPQVFHRASCFDIYSKLLDIINLVIQHLLW